VRAEGDAESEKREEDAPVAAAAAAAAKEKAPWAKLISQSQQVRVRIGVAQFSVLHSRHDSGHGQDSMLCSLGTNALLLDRSWRLVGLRIYVLELVCIGFRLVRRLQCSFGRLECDVCVVS
jgi:hypothetical protein